MSNFKQGYFSLIQYQDCPDRMEVVNIGLVIIVPKSEELLVDVIRDFARVCRFFGDAAVEYNEMFANSIANRIRKECICTLPALKHFRDTRANKYRLTEPRSMAIEKS